MATDQPLLYAVVVVVGGRQGILGGDPRQRFYFYGSAKQAIVAIERCGVRDDQPFCAKAPSEQRANIFLGETFHARPRLPVRKAAGSPAATRGTRMLID